MNESQILREEEKRNKFILQSNVQNMQTQVKLISFDELHDQLKIFQYDNQILKKDLELQKNEKNDLIQEMTDLKKKYENLENDLEQQKQEILRLNSEFENQKKNVREKNQVIREQNNALSKTLEILEFNNTKTLANIKLIQQLFPNDKGISETIEKFILKTIKKYDEQEIADIKRELKKNSLYLEEFAKMIGYLSTSLNEKKEKLQGLYQSMKISKMLKPQDVTSAKEEQSEHEEVYREMNNQKFQDLNTQIEFLVDKFTANQKVEALGQTEEKIEKINTLKKTVKQLKDKNNLWKKQYKNTELLVKSNEDTIQEILGKMKKMAEKEGLGKSHIHNSFVKQTVPIGLNKESQKSNVEEAVSDLPQEIQIPDYKPVLTSYFNLIEDYVEELKDQNDNRLRELEKETGMQKGQNQQNVTLLKNNLKKLATEKEDLEKEFELLKGKIKKQEIQNKELILNYQKREIFQNSREKMMDEYSLKKLEDFQNEIKLKSEIIQQLLKNNKELMDKQVEMQKERLEVLRDKQHCEDLFNYFNQKATKIHLMGEDLSKVIRENKKLRRFIEEIYHMVSDSVNVFSKDLGSSGEHLDQIQTEIMLGLVQASQSKENFDTQVFQQYLTEQNKEIPLNSKNKRKLQTEAEAPTTKAVDEKEANYKKLVRVLNEMGEENLKQRDVQLLGKLNQNMVENISLKKQVEIQKKKIDQLGIDLEQYKRQVTKIFLLEGKIEKMVEQNMELKNLLMKYQSESLKKTNEHSLRTLDFGNKLKNSESLIEKLSEKVIRLKNEKLNSEKKVQILMSKAKKANDDLIYEEKEKELEISKYKQLVDEKNLLIAEQEVKLERMNKQMEQLNQLKNDHAKNLQENIALKKINGVLEEHLFSIAERDQSTKQKFDKEIQKQRKNIDKKVNEQVDLMQEKLDMEFKINELQGDIKELKLNLTQKEEKIKQINDKNQKLQSQISDQEFSLSQLKSEKEKGKMKIELLEKEKEDLQEEFLKIRNQLNTQDTQEYAKENELKEQFKENMDEELLLSQNQKEQQEDENKNQLTNINIEKKKLESENEYLKNRLKTRNKQLIQFNTYLASLQENDKNNSNGLQTTKLLYQLKNNMREVDILKTKNKQLQMLYQNLQNSIDNIYITPPNRQNNLMDSKIIDLKSNFDQLYIDNYNLKVQFDVLVDCYEQKEKEILEKYENIQKKLALEENKCLNLTDELNKKQFKYDELKQKQENQKEEQNQLMKQINDLKFQQIETMETKMGIPVDIRKQQQELKEKYQKEIDELKKFLNTSEEWNEKLNKELIGLKNENQKIVDLQKEIDFLKFSNEQLIQKLKNFENQKTHKEFQEDKQKDEKIVNLLDQISNLNEKIEELQKDNQTLEIQLNSKQKQLEQTENELISENQKRTNEEKLTESQLLIQKDQENSVQEIQKDLIRVKIDLQTKIEEIDNLKEDNEQIQKENSGKTEEINNQKNTIKTLENQLNLKIQEIQQLQKQTSEKTQQNQQINYEQEFINIKKKYDALFQQLQDVNDKNTDQNETIQKLQKENKDLKKQSAKAPEVSQLEKTNLELKQEKIKMHSELDLLNQKLNAEIKEGLTLKNLLKLKTDELKKKTEELNKHDDLMEEILEKFDENSNEGIKETLSLYQNEKITLEKQVNVLKEEVNKISKNFSDFKNETNSLIEKQTKELEELKIKGLK